MKHVYISADYDPNDGDQEVVEILNAWGKDNKHLVELVDMAKVASGTVANDPDCRIINSCSYLRHEFEQAKKKGKNKIGFVSPARRY